MSYSSEATAQHYAPIISDDIGKGLKVLKCVQTGRLTAQIHFIDGSHLTVSGLLAFEINRRLAQGREDG